MLHNFLSRPLSLLGWTFLMLFWLDFHHVQSNLYKGFRTSSTTSLQWAQESPHHTSLYLSSLATGCGLHQVQDTDICIKNSHGLHTLQPPHSFVCLHPLQKPEVSKSTSGTITEMHGPFSEHVHSLFFAGGMIFLTLSGSLNPWQYLLTTNF